MAHAKANIGTVDYATAIIAGHHSLTADEGPELGGKDAGPAPYDLLSSALGACTVITLRMYAERKQWPVTSVQADIHFKREGRAQAVDEGDLSGVGGIQKTVAFGRPLFDGGGPRAPVARGLEGRGILDTDFRGNRPGVHLPDGIGTSFD